MDENRESKENKGSYRSFSRLLILCLLGVVVLCSCGVLVAKSVSANAQPAPTVTPIPELTPEPTSAPTPSAPPLTAVPTAVPTAAPAAVQPATPTDLQPEVYYVKTQKREVGPFADEQAARLALDALIKYYYDSLELGSNEGVTTRIDGEYEITAVAADEDTELISDESALKNLRRAGLEVVIEQTGTERVEVPCKVEDESSAALTKGMRLIRSMGRKGLEDVTTTVKYVNGKKADTQSSSVVLIEMLPMTVIVGSEKPTSNSDPSRTEGEKPELPEGLSLITPMQSAKLSTTFGAYKQSFSYGLDYTVRKQKNEVYASGAGTVSALMQRGAYGLCMDISHGDGVVTRYANLTDTLFEVGDAVAQGDVIAHVAETLHFELRVRGIAYNPRHFLDK